jgi:hypothetical protein
MPFTSRIKAWIAKTWQKITLTIGNTVLGIIIKLHAKIVKLIPF